MQLVERRTLESPFASVLGPATHARLDAASAVRLGQISVATANRRYDSSAARVEAVPPRAFPRQEVYMDPTILTFVLATLVAEKGRGVVCDLGWAMKGPDLVMEISVENRTDEPVRIWGTEGMCTPNRAKLSELQPADRTLLKGVRVETKNFNGPINKTRTIEFEAKGTGDVAFECASCGSVSGAR